jgi:2-polyprenyl-3-methyl-5-hydroxy-6-metoxy-1,4-benzoquinol methylase
LSILDVGCIGPSPLDFWRPLLALYDGQFTLTGIDPNAAGIEKTRARLADFSRHPITLRAGSGYDLTRLFPEQRFDVIVFTQVLEHVYRRKEFLEQVKSVCRPGGHLLFTLDSGHYPRQSGWRDLAKTVLARLGNESHYEHAWRDDEVDPLLAALGLEIVNREYYCTVSSKLLHKTTLATDQMNPFMRLWFEQEYFLNQHMRQDRLTKSQFLILFYDVLFPQVG